MFKIKFLYNNRTNQFQIKKFEDSLTRTARPSAKLADRSCDSAADELSK